MKRSEISAAIARALALFEAKGWTLPPSAHWSAAQFEADPETAHHLSQHQMGWDVTDFGLGDFARRGLTLFCLRNGLQGDPLSMPYAEKLLVVGEGQETPMHLHRIKMEDIINRAGGVLALEFMGADEAGRPTDAPTTLRVDGERRSLRPRETLRLNPGESVTIPRGVYHRFWAEGGLALVGEVSQVNDDRADNYFLEPIGRFAKIEEDAPPLRLLWNEIAVSRRPST